MSKKIQAFFLLLKQKMARMQALCLFFLLWASTGEAEYFKYQDPKQRLATRIKDLLKRMTLEEKIGQMTQIERKVATSQILKDYFIGKKCYKLINKF